MVATDVFDAAGNIDRLELLRHFGRVGLFTRALDGSSALWDAGMFEMTGFDPAAGAPTWAVFLSRVHAEDRDDLDAHFRSLGLRAARGDRHFRFVLPDGRECLMHSLYEVRPGEPGRAGQVVGVMVDDSAAGQRLQEGERSRDFLKRALELSGVSVWSIDLAAQRVSFNAVGFEVLGMRNDPAGMPLDAVRDNIHPEDRAAVVRAARQAVAAEGAVDVAARYRTVDGRWRMLLTRRLAVRDEAGRATSLLGVSLDLGGRDADRARMAALAERTQLVAQGMGVGFWERAADGDAVLWDAQMYRLYGRDPARLPPTMSEWIDGYVQPSARGEVRRVLQADIAAWAPETVMTVPVRGDDGRTRWVRAWTRRLVRDGQRIAMGMHLDVTEQVQHEALQRESERVARASREKSAFMAVMSHRLRTPLNAVLGFAQVMAQDPTEPLSPRQRERLARIDAAAAELLAMVDDVFEIAALDAEPAPPVRVPVPLAAILTPLREAIEPMSRLLGVELGFPQALPDVRVHTDRRLLGQALRHLVAHAVRRNQRGGHVTLAAATEAGWARLELRDGGPRLSAEQRELLFDTPAADDGQATHGDALVGLDLVRQALGRLGAQVEWMHPDPADNILLVRLPLAEQAGPSVPAALTLLCIEDNPVNMMLVHELVAMRPGIVLHSAVDGHSGLAAALALRPDVVLLDLHLPDMDGRQVAGRLRADPRTAGSRLIALSANAMPEDILAARAQGFDDYWTKPIDFDRFLGGLDAIAIELARARAAP